MAQMVECSDAVLPEDLFDLTILGLNEDDGSREPCITLNIPEEFEGSSSWIDKYGSLQATQYDYSGSGVLSVNLRDVLEEYLQLDHNKEDDCQSMIPMVKLLREYATKINARYKELTK